MTDENRPQPDPDEDPTTVTRWPPFGQQGEQAPSVDETHTQWVAADQPSAGGEPQWAEWDQPWEPPDEPSDQAAAPVPTSDQAAAPPLPTPAAPPQPAAHPAQPGPADETGTAAQPDGPVAARTTSWANLHALRVLAQVACPILLLVGLTFGNDSSQTGWEAYTAWAIFAAVCAFIQLAPLVGRSLGLTTENSWFLAAVGTAGLVGYWVIIVLPGVSSNSGFAQTLAAGFAVIGLWLSPGRRV